MTPKIARLRESLVDRPCGTRSKYVLGCHCDRCRSANTLYYHQRMKRKIFDGPNPLVPADKARAHILYLSGLGIGRDSIAAATGTCRTSLTEIRRGIKRNIRFQTEQKILACDLSIANDRSYIPAEETWRILDDLISWGYTKTQLARWLGQKANPPSLQLSRRRVTAKKALAVRKLAEEINAGLRRRS